jgi:hypothetical protein
LNRRYTQIDADDKERWKRLEIEYGGQNNGLPPQALDCGGSHPPLFFQ